MAEKCDQVTPFLLNRPNGGFSSLVRKKIYGALELTSGLKRCQQLYEEIPSHQTLTDFTWHALEKMAVNYQVSDDALKRIPRTGPCVLVANHPYGGIEGVVLLHLLSRLRPDFKVMGNFLLGRIPQLRNHLIEVDPFGGAHASRNNIAPMRQARQLLRDGGLLVIFPAGEVSSWKSMRSGVVDPTWSVNVARLIRSSKAPVLPIYFPGHNGPLFQVAGIAHPRLRTLLLPRMLLKGQPRTLFPVIGNQIPAKRCAALEDDKQLIDYLRLRTYSLGLEKSTGSDGQLTEDHEQKKRDLELIDPLPADLLKQDLAALPEQQCLVDSGEYSVFYATAEQLPHLLVEIGRLREATFRLAGEGTGNAVDLDDFDRQYHHLFVWNREKEEIVGAYRIGQVDRLMAANGILGLYSSSLFDFKPKLYDALSQGLELGRSFVRSEYQRSYAPLLLLWKGIGHYLLQYPQYRYLFGPVSISRDYGEASRQLMTSSLTRHYLVAELAKLVRPRLPVAVKPMKVPGFSRSLCDQLLQDVDDISALVADLEQDSKGIPVLLRHYIGLGGKLLAFNLDPDFSDVIDGLLLVDLPNADKKQLQRYMGREGYKMYVGYHQGNDAEGEAA